jgi:hypothetical protein
MSAPAPRRSARLAAKKSRSAPSESLPATETLFPNRPILCKEVNIIHLVGREVHERLLLVAPQDRWEPVSEEECNQSLKYLLSLFSEENLVHWFFSDGTVEMKRKPKNHHTLILEIYKHLAEQPIVLAVDPKFRERAVKKVNDILNYLCKKKDLELMAFYAPIFNEFKQTAAAIELHPWYEEE